MTKPKRKPLTFSDKYQAMLRAGGQCPYCGGGLEHHHEDGARVAFDHVIPITRGGPDDVRNLIASCFGCNARKHTKTGLEFLCEQMGIGVHWFARFNPERDGFLADIDADDELIVDLGAFLAGFDEVAEGQYDDYALLYELDQDMEESEAEFTRQLNEEMEEFYRMVEESSP